MATTTTGGLVVGVFPTRGRAEQAVLDLRDAGFAEDQLGLVSRTDHVPEHRSGLADDPTHTRWEEGSGLGAAAGAVTGTGLGLAVLAGLIPAVGPAIAGGVLMALFASAGTGATVGTVLGALVGLGVPETDSQFYEGEVHAGRAVVTVHSGKRADEAAKILTANGSVPRGS